MERAPNSRLVLLINHSTERKNFMSLVTFNFESQYLGNNHDIGIILPDKPRGISPAEFYGSGKKYKVLWLLHGSYGDYSDWIRKSMIELYACEKDLIVVMPSGLNAMYTNWPGFATGYLWTDYFFEELMPLIYNWFPASDKQEDNFIAGLSMGGGAGAIKLAVNHPEKFNAAAVLSSCPKNFSEYHIENMDPRTYNNVMNFGSLEAYQKSEENTWDILKEKVKNHSPLPRLYLCCGTNDKVVYKNYCAFKEYALKIGLDATFVEEEGYNHEWRFWNLYIQKALTFFGLDQMDAGNPF